MLYSTFIAFSRILAIVPNNSDAVQVLRHHQRYYHSSAKFIIGLFDVHLAVHQLIYERRSTSCPRGHSCTSMCNCPFIAALGLLLGGRSRGAVEWRLVCRCNELDQNHSCAEQPSSLRQSAVPGCLRLDGCCLRSPDKLHFRQRHVWDEPSQP